MKKQSITLEMIFNRMDEMYSDFSNKFEELKEKFTQITGNNSENSIQNSTNDIPNTEYVTITNDDVFVGGNPTRRYHGQDLYNYYHLTAYFKEARDIIRDEYGYELQEIHCLQSSTNGEYAKTGNPVADKDGENAWIRVVYLDKNKQKAVSLWAFDSAYGSDSGCASYCANYCGGIVRYDASLRAGLFGKSYD